MTRQEAIEAIYDVINSGIIDSELEEDLTEVCNHICADDFDKCQCDESGDCCECKFIICNHDCDDEEY